jgi:hypothetical protein
VVRDNETTVWSLLDRCGLFSSLASIGPVPKLPSLRVYPDQPGIGVAGTPELGVACDNVTAVFGLGTDLPRSMLRPPYALFHCSVPLESALTRNISPPAPWEEVRLVTRKPPSEVSLPEPPGSWDTPPKVLFHASTGPARAEGTITVKTTINIRSIPAQASFAALISLEIRHFPNGAWMASDKSVSSNDEFSI